MNQHICPENTEISQIDFANASYSISPERESIPDESLSHSIAQYGILHPPIIKEKNSGLFVIVTGRKRLTALHTLFQKEKSCTCMVIPAQIPEIDTFSIMLEEVLTSRQLTPIEKAIFLQKISPLAEENHIVKKFLPRLDLPPAPFSIKQSIILLTLEESLVLAIHHGTINETVARDMLPLTPQDRLAVFNIISSLRLNTAYQKKLLNICRELAGRENRTIISILADNGVQDILNHKKANTPQKTKNLMNWLSGRHMPRSHQAEVEFKRFVASMHLPRNVSVDHTPFFEDDSVILSIIFSNRESLQTAWDTIKNEIEDKGN
ncbi:MAG: ParB N-terminal domain-containing protein [Deltaproteobacteria bacterium]|jgi:ParB-like chromosome segregation protein Spo0J|nr:ParB N-terminal domain-containing protein [Deltaproteobacteria bacterium]